LIGLRLAGDLDQTIFKPALFNNHPRGKRPGNFLSKTPQLVNRQGFKVVPIHDLAQSFCSRLFPGAARAGQSDPGCSNIKQNCQSVRNPASWRGSHFNWHRVSIAAEAGHT
jgi:hypothetical protein